LPLRLTESIARRALKSDEFAMALVTIKPTAVDERIANVIASHTTPAVEGVAQLLTWEADEKVLLALAIAGWLYAARRPALRPIANHMVAVSLLSSILPHLLKSAVDQIRPDRLTVKGHRRGVPFSGRPRDAFPSGHALHMGALASAAGLLPSPQRRFARAVAVALSATRILLLAHWASDVVVGFAAGALVERLIRPITPGSAKQRRREV
jgi:membrane-associated phospholipid phosphatase